MKPFLPLLLLLGITAACAPEMPPMTPEETQRMNQLTATMTTRCIGRYLIDLPEAFVLNEISTTKLEDVEIIKVEPMHEVDFQLLLERRDPELKTKHMDGEPSNPFLKKYEMLPPGGIGKIFNRAYRSGAADVARVLELMAWKDGYLLSATIQAKDDTGTAYENEPWAKSSPNDVPQKLAHLLDVYNRLQGRKDTEVPSGPGVCFPNGFLRGPATDHEQIDLHYHLSQSKDAYFTFHSLSDLIQDNKLLDRGPAIEKALKHVSGRTLRKGKVTGSIPSTQEWLLTRKSEESDLMLLDFTLEANAKIGSAQTPVLVLDFVSGVEAPGPALTLEEAAVRKPLSSKPFNEAESIALWDKVVPTLRPRPGAF